jgi:hypothetical protein
MHIRLPHFQQHSPRANAELATLVVAAALAAAAFVASLSGGLGAAAVHAQSPLNVTLATTDTGFDCRDGCDHVTFEGAWQPTISVDLGTLLQITFVWDHAGYINDEHIMVLEGYDLEWDKISATNREASLQLIADQPGEFTLKCDIECEVHDYMQHAALHVGETGGAAAAKTPTELTLTPSEWVTTGDPVNLMVTLKGADEKPVPKAHVDLLVDGELGVYSGTMKIGRVETDDNGVAFLDYSPTLPSESATVRARFDGMGIYAGSEQDVVIQTVGQMPPAYRVPEVGLTTLRSVAPKAFGATILAVWLVLGFVAFQIIGILRARPGA